MGVKIEGTFVGGLAMRMSHLPSSVSLITDPPVDNGGEGKSYSPTDLVATGLGSCMMSVMAIAAKKDGINLTGMNCTIEKNMSLDLPRRIISLDVNIILPRTLDDHTRQKMIEIANNCPVIHSLHSDIKINKTYRFE